MELWLRNVNDFYYSSLFKIKRESETKLVEVFGQIGFNGQTK